MFHRTMAVMSGVGFVAAAWTSIAGGILAGLYLALLFGLGFFLSVRALRRERSPAPESAERSPATLYRTGAVAWLAIGGGVGTLAVAALTGLVPWQGEKFYPVLGLIGAGLALFLGSASLWAWLKSRS